MQSDADLRMAMLLQKQFDLEFNIERPPVNLTYDSPKGHKSKLKQTETVAKGSLIDPSWELVDPTPNIHNLFVQFNDRFFWDKLMTVAVSWSKRMTTCAGICSYQGRGGMCKITLSEPLLKLRPRKDLIETLLHEMIHAFLFVTHNNKDRDGHGPEFHKHMYRINGEAGTKITVYHDFHDEVRLYKQHWWRCDGPCQKRPPFFGMVRRAMNRAPGPYDRWWAQHQQTCGGTFIKVKEPEKIAKKGGKTKENIKPKNDIRNFIPTKGNNNTNKPNILGNNSINNVFGAYGAKSHTSNSPKMKPTTFGTPGAKLGTFTTPAARPRSFSTPDAKSDTFNTPRNTSTNLPNNFGNGGSSGAKPGTLGNKSRNFGNTGLVNMNGTVVLNSKKGSKTQDTIITTDNNVASFTDMPNLNGGPNINKPSLNKKPGVNNKASNIVGFKDLTRGTIVPNLNKPSTSTSNIVGYKDLNKPPVPCNPTFSGTGSRLTQPNTSETNPNYSTVRNHWLNKFNQPQVELKRKTNSTSPLGKKPKTEDTKCPNCKLNIPKNELDAHIDFCLNKRTNSSSPLVPKSDPKVTKCPNCNLVFSEKEINSHLDICLNADVSITSEFSNEESFKMIECPVCNIIVEEGLLNEHLDKCLSLGEDEQASECEENALKHIGNSSTDVQVTRNSETSSNTVDTSSKCIVNGSKHLENNSKIEYNQCEICDTIVPALTLESHTQYCLEQCFNKYEELDKSTDSVKCLVCDKDVEKLELNTHLEDCMGTVFEKDDMDLDDQEPDEPEPDSHTFNCPICMSQIEELQMNDHIDICLRKVGDDLDL